MPQLPRGRHLHYQVRSCKWKCFAQGGRNRVFGDSVPAIRYLLGQCSPIDKTLLPPTVTTRNWPADFSVSSIETTMSLERNLSRQPSKLLITALCFAVGFGIIEFRAIRA